MKKVLKSLAVLSSILLASCSEIKEVNDSPVSGLPNIIIIVTDDQGYADVGFRNSPIQTPNIDRLAKDGIILNRFYTCPVCSPTRR